MLKFNLFTGWTFDFQDLYFNDYTAHIYLLSMLCMQQ